MRLANKEQLVAAMKKDPGSMADLILDLNKKLEFVSTGLQAFNGSSKVDGMFDSTRASVYRHLIDQFTHYIRSACKLYRGGNFQALGKLPDEVTMQELEELLEEGRKGLILLRSQIGRQLLSSTLMKNNPCHILYTKQGVTTDKFDSLKQGLEVACKTIQQALDSTPNCTFKEFFQKWFEDYTLKDELVLRACSKIQTMRATGSYIVGSTLEIALIAEALMYALHESPHDLTYLDSKVTLTSLVQAVGAARAEG